MNKPSRARLHNPRVGRQGEHELELQITSSPTLLADFREIAGDVLSFHRQFPVGLFEVRVSATSYWTPGKGSQVDIWGASPDSKTVHLIELKKPGNELLGALPEIVYYGRLLHYVRIGLPDGQRISGGGEGFEAVRRANRIVFWLVGNRVHPLLYHNGDSPLAWLNEAMRNDGLEFRILPYDSARDGTIKQWRADDLWPR
jgi:hypothetical protein